MSFVDRLRQAREQVNVDHEELARVDAMSIFELVMECESLEELKQAVLVIADRAGLEIYAHDSD